MIFPIWLSKMRKDEIVAEVDVLRGCIKSTSIAWLTALELPVLDTLIIGAWSDESAEALDRFCDEHRTNSVLLRIDKPIQRWTNRRGGYIVGRHEMESIVRELRGEGYLTLALEPASPYEDEASMVGLVIPEQSKVVIEIVGEGFDASDLQRSDTGVHERWEAYLNLRDGGFDRVERVFLIDNKNYKHSVEERLVKIGARLINPAFPDEARKQYPASELKNRGFVFLQESGQASLLT